jgi:hypothetical protein
VAYSLPLPAQWAARGWKVKIRDRERLEPPHVTVMFRAKGWRWNLRAGGFMDESPEPKEVPQDLIDFIVTNLAVLRAQWDAMYPKNPIALREAGDD